MGRKRRGRLLHYKNNEFGLLFPIALVLLFFMSSACLDFIFTYKNQIKTYNSLEMFNVRATINLLEQL